MPGVSSNGHHTHGRTHRPHLPPRRYHGQLADEAQTPMGRVPRRPGACRQDKDTHERATSTAQAHIFLWPPYHSCHHILAHHPRQYGTHTPNRQVSVFFSPLIQVTSAFKTQLIDTLCRWRLILLSPEEEEEISSQLAGNGWYQAVGDILSQEGDTPQIVPPSDWRFLWVRSTLRRLETVIPLLQKEGELEAKWLECGPDDVPLPPPADHPLKPRPRASEYVRRFAELSCGRAPPPVPHGVLGPPYSLIVVDKPDSSNAFSYGFGPDGGGGIVVFSGFLDDIMSKYPLLDPSAAQQPQQQRSWWSSLFGSFSSVHPPAYQRPMPTEEQTSELAILLAHELAHLILSHHLETLSSGSIIWPGLLSIGTDIIRALIFPFTMMCEFYFLLC